MLKALADNRDQMSRPPSAAVAAIYGMEENAYGEALRGLRGDRGSLIGGTIVHYEDLKPSPWADRFTDTLEQVAESGGLVEGGQDDSEHSCHSSISGGS